MLDKVLIANRGEIALRIHRACKEMGISTVAVHSTADSDAMHVRLADESVCIGEPAPAQSYLNTAALLTAATVTNADAIHPGYGLLSENADFSQMVAEHGFIFIGPSPDHIRMMGDKITAKETMKRLGVPVTPGSDGAVNDEAEAAKAAEEIGYPVLVKASGGGGGRGMKLAATADDIGEAFSTARAEAMACFGNDEVYLEKYLVHPRHVEIQVLADSFGHVIHLGDRDCSLQRRNQKVLEEAPSPALNAEMRAEIGGRVVDAITELGYLGAGTLEFLYEEGIFYFIEMNTRVQVEHPVTEMITGVDIVREQIRIAAGAELAYTPDDITFPGHALECRINAESPTTFIPAPGRVGDYHPPGGLGVRVDSALYAGYEIPPYYDSLISKLIVHGKTRNEALMRMRRALSEYVIEGVETTIPLHQKLCESPDFVNGDYDIHWLEKFVGLS
ncbi:MAG: acetyl-CoA carboxylase biotin carboxylase subunit [Alphaproteobacteria bacterium]|nr:acetyl-CoA carboxylase biotin carboxylase subunit [Alphaproteobacteria bacterium]